MILLLLNSIRTRIEGIFVFHRESHKRSVSSFLDERQKYLGSNKPRIFDEIPEGREVVGSKTTTDSKRTKNVSVNVCAFFDL